MKVLVTGANGFIGSHLCPLLESQEHYVVRAMRSSLPGAANEHGHGVHIPTLDDKTDWSAALEEVEAVVHMAARVHVLYEKVSDPMSQFRTRNVDATMRLAQQAVAAGVKRFIFISTIGVLGNYNAKDRPFTERDTPQPGNEYAASKWEAEQALTAYCDTVDMELVILRPPLVYGPGVKANFFRLMCAVSSGRPLPFGRVVNSRDFISVANLCDVISLCLHHPEATGETFLVADGHPISTPDLIRELGRHLGKKRVWLLPIPVRWLSSIAQLLGKQRLYHSVCSSLRVDMSHLQKTLDWQPIQSFDDGLEEVTGWYRFGLRPEQGTLEVK